MPYLELLILLLPLVQCDKRPPDIVFILADDLGWADVSYHGSPQIPTPNIDTLAADGIIISNYYTQPACTPSRAALMTGIYPMRLGMLLPSVTQASPSGLPLDVRILPQYLSQLGYESHLIGKWDLGSCSESLTPTFRGFDSFYGYYYGEEDYFNHTVTYEGDRGLDFWFNSEPLWSEFGKYSTHLYTERAQHIITNRNKSKPLFLLLSHQAVHSAEEYSPLEAPEEYIEKFPYIGEKNRTIYAGMLDALDQSVGEVFEMLRGADMLDNVVVVFSSDNGGAALGAHSSRGINWPLRGQKGGLFEGGTRAAAFIWSPLLDRNRTLSNQLMHIVDWVPTLYSIGGGDVRNLRELDGIDMWHPLSLGLNSPRVEMLYNYDKWVLQSMAIRDSRYKLVIDEGSSYNQRYSVPGGSRPDDDLDELLSQSKVASVLRDLYRTTELNFPNGWRERATVNCGENNVENFSTEDTVYLFDVVNDPCELSNLASSHPEVVVDLKKRLDAYAADAIQPKIPPVDPAGLPQYHNGTWAPWLDSPL